MRKVNLQMIRAAIFKVSSMIFNEKAAIIAD